MNKILLLLPILLFSMANTLTAANYYFMATEDHNYVNPENWYPAYPGSEIEKNDSVFILEDVYVRGINLEVKGVMSIEWGVKVLARSLSISEGASLVNFGKIIAEKINNFGSISNKIAGSINLSNYSAYTTAQTYNGGSSKFITTKGLVNEGRFDNYGSCVVGSYFENRAVFNQLKTSQLRVLGQYLLADGSTLYQSRYSYFDRKPNLYR